MAMTYNEYAQLLQTFDTKTNKLWKAENFTAFNFNDIGTCD